MPSIQESSRATPFADIIDVVVARLVAGVATTPRHVVAIPEDMLHQYHAQESLLVAFSTPSPVPRCGSGRYAALAFRYVTVVVLTQSLLDSAGEDIAAVKAHVTLEEAVANCLHLQGPVGASYNLRTGVQIEWVDGGQDVVRQIKVDPGMLKSGLRFRVEYVAPMQVKRD